MVTVIRKSMATLTESRHEILHAVSWQARANSWSPATDIFETDQLYIVRMEVAGMRDVDFEIAVDHNIVYVSGNRPDLPQRRAYHQMEIRFGKFLSSVNLPGPVNVEESQAEYEDGFLIIKFPKIKTHQIKIE